MTKHPIGYTSDINTRPNCSVPGCNRLAVNMSSKKGLYYWRRSAWILDQYKDAEDIWCCSYHHCKEIARRNSVKSAKHLTAARQGMSITEYQHQHHPYLRYRKDYCENIDGRLGFKCTTNIHWPGMLDIDHINGDPYNHNVTNLQTLCKCCHSYKSWKNQDYATPGRKTGNQSLYGNV